jgi:hypothetical protein
MTSQSQSPGGYSGVGRVLLVIPIVLVLALVVYALIFGSGIVFGSPTTEAGTGAAVASAPPSTGAG